MIYNIISLDAFTARTVRKLADGRWLLVKEGEEPYRITYSTRTTITSCPNCGAPYEGKERCEYCGTYLG